MFFDFLSDTRAVFPEEERDLSELCEELRADTEFIGFMPAVRLDLWPVYALGCTHASRFTGSHLAPKIYIMPIDVSDRAVYPELSDTVHAFYTSFERKGENNENKEKASLIKQLFSRKSSAESTLPQDTRYGIEITEIIPIIAPSLRSAHPLRLSRSCECDLLYFRLALPNGTPAHLFAVCGAPEQVWRSLIEKYEVKAEMIIHSHKGFGHWFTSTPLYDYLTVTKKPHLLPRFYFRGKFITTDDSPEGSTPAELLTDDLCGGESIIYRLPNKL